jgi:hypothetical protein
MNQALVRVLHWEEVALNIHLKQAESKLQGGALYYHSALRLFDTEEIVPAVVLDD